MGERQTLPVIQAGVGSFGGYWIDVVRRVPRVRHVALVDPHADPQGLDEARRRAGLREGAVFDDLKEALRKVDARAVLDITPASVHRRVSGTALRAGLHVLVEKPLAPDLASARFLAGLARDCRRTLMVSQNYRFQPAARAIRQFLTEGRAGRLTHVAVDYQMPIQVGGWRARMEDPFLRDMAVHHFDLLRYFLGGKARRIAATSWRPPWSSTRGDPCSAAIFEWSRGVRVSYLGCWSVPGRDTGWNGRWQFIGSAGTLVWDEAGEELPLAFHPGALERTVYHTRPGKPVRVRVPSRKRTSTMLALEHFRDCVLAGRRPETSAQDNLETLELVHSAVRSAKGKSRRAQ